MESVCAPNVVYISENGTGLLGEQNFHRGKGELKRNTQRPVLKLSIHSFCILSYDGQNKFSKECGLVLPLSRSSILSFP